MTCTSTQNPAAKFSKPLNTVVFSISIPSQVFLNNLVLIREPTALLLFSKQLRVKTRILPRSQPITRNIDACQDTLNLIHLDTCKGDMLCVP